MLWDVVTVPLGAFDPADNIVLIAMDWLTLVFWTIDIAATFFTGFLQGNRVVMDRRQVFVKYVTTMFFVDLSIVGLDWFFTALKVSGSDAISMRADDVSRLV